MTLTIYLTLMFVHALEHIAQLTQLYILHWPRMECLGLIGLLWPEGVRSEWLHYLFALYTLGGLWYLRRSFPNQPWWETTIILAWFHHLEHAILLGQALAHHTILGCPMPCTFFQLWVPRIELHALYNLAVLLPMYLALKANELMPSRPE